MNRILLIAITISLSGCSLIPFYHRPSSPVPAQFPYTSSKTQIGKGQASDIAWHDFFKDPRLQQLIELSLKNNRDYRVALLNVDQLRAQYRIVRYGLWPSVGLEATKLRQRQLAVNQNYSKVSNYNASVNIAWELDFFGHIRSLKAQVLEQYLATQEASRSAQIALVAQVAQQYLLERSLDEQLIVLRQTQKSVQSYLDLINKSYQLGNSSEMDLRLAQTQVESIRGAVANDERQLALARDALDLLIGQTVPEDLPPPQSLKSQDIIADLPVGLSSDLIQRRPDILEAEHQLKAANANIGVVRSSFFPSVTLTASDGTASVQLAKLFTSGTQIWSFSPQISLPLFNENTNLANLDAAGVLKQIQIAQYEKTIQTAFKEVSDAIISRDTFNEQVLAGQGLVLAEQKRYDLSLERYHQGIDSYLTVLLAQQDLYSAQENLITLSMERLDNLITLYKALGGGWGKT